MTEAVIIGKSMDWFLYDNDLSHERVQLLGVKIGKQLKLKSHIEELCREAAYKLHALRRI